MPHLSHSGFDGPRGCPFLASPQVAHLACASKARTREPCCGTRDFTRELPSVKSHLGHEGPFPDIRGQCPEMGQKCPEKT